MTLAWVMIILILSVLIILLCVIIGISWLVRIKINYSREKITPFECGFDPLISKHISFYIRFYVFSLIFLVFDVEIILLLPVVLIFKIIVFSYWRLLLFIYFMILLIVGLGLEYLESSLEWRI